MKRVSLEAIKTDQSLKKHFPNVRIYSEEWGCYWRGQEGYTTNPEEAKVYLIDEALRISGHCGPEKKIWYEEADCNGSGEVEKVNGLVNISLVMKAWVHLRKTEQTIPDETLDFMRDVSIELLKSGHYSIQSLLASKTEEIERLERKWNNQKTWIERYQKEIAHKDTIIKLAVEALEYYRDYTDNPHKAIKALQKIKEVKG